MSAKATFLGLSSALFLTLAGCDDASTDETGEQFSLQCEQISLTAIYNDPLNYNTEDVCTTGVLVMDFPFTYLVSDVATDRPRGRSIVMDGSSYDARLDEYQNGDRVIVGGQFEVSEPCYRNHVLDQANEDGTTTFCGAGTDVPMRIRISYIEPEAD